MANTGLLHVTFTGPDEGTDLSALVGLQRDFGRSVEIGILVYPPKTGEPLYPRGSWIHKFLEVSRPDARLALHLCGEAVDMFLGQDRQCMDLARHFATVQLNFFHGVKPVSARDIMKAADIFAEEHERFLPDALDSGVVIVPDNAPNRPVIQELLEEQNRLVSSDPRRLLSPIACLFDSSGGKGIAAKHWPYAHDTVICGYAGGLTPSNVSEQNDYIRDSAKGHPYWLDMQKGVRTFSGPEDRRGFFDVGKCREVMHELGF